MYACLIETMRETLNAKYTRDVGYSFEKLFTYTLNQMKKGAANS